MGNTNHSPLSASSRTSAPPTCAPVSPRTLEGSSLEGRRGQLLLNLLFAANALAESHLQSLTEFHVTTCQECHRVLRPGGAAPYSHAHNCRAGRVLRILAEMQELSGGGELWHRNAIDQADGFAAFLDGGAR